MAPAEAGAEVNVAEVEGVRLTWGESVRWDDRRQRLYLVDCATQKLHWLDGGAGPLHELKLPSMPAGVVLTDGDPLVVCLDDGLHVVDPDGGTVELLAPYPDGMHGRANDANGDGAGRLITGTLNITSGPPGALWRYAVDDGWVLLDPSFGNTNGPHVIGDGAVLVCGDTSAAAVFAYDYDSAAGTTVGERRTYLDESQSAVDGAPDGAAVDGKGGLWACVLGSGRLAHVDAAGALVEVVDLPIASPSDIAFGGAGLDRAYVTSIALDLGHGSPPTAQDGALLVLDGLGVTGRPESRFALRS